jgi:electron transfer flavoprotein alpha subunit
MESILFLAHVEPDGTLSRASLEALGAAQRLTSELNGSAFAVGLAGENAEAAAGSIVSCGASRFLAVSGPEFAESRYSTDAAAAEALCRASGASLIVAAGVSRWSRALPGVACRLGGRIDTHITGIASDENGPAVTRWFYRQRMEGVLRRSGRPWALLVEPGSQPAWRGAAGTVPVEFLDVPGPVLRTRVAGLQAPALDQQTIRPDAKLLFVAGAGWTKKQPDGQAHVEDAARIILGFINAAGASLGSSKSLVDLSGEGEAVLPFLTHLNQVGQTGSTPRHPKGLATCCHGEEPHVVGWRFINERRAVNLDPNCGWARGKADVLYVADAFAVMAKVNELLAERGKGQQA